MLRPVSQKLWIKNFRAICDAKTLKITAYTIYHTVHC